MYVIGKKYMIVNNTLYYKLINQKIIIFYFLILVLLLGSCRGKKDYNVLVIQSYESSFPAYEYINSAISKEFKKNDVNANITTYFLDCESYLATDEVIVLDNYLDSINKSGNIPDIILVNDDQATYSLLKTFNPLIKEVPIVFFGINYPNWELISSYDNVTGIWTKPDFAATARMAESIFGKVRITYMSDSTYLGNIITSEIKKQIAGTNIKYVSNYDLTGNSFMFDVIVAKQRPDSLTINEAPIRAIKGENTLWLISGIDGYRVFMFTKRDITTVKMGIYSNYPSFIAINEGLGFRQGLLAGYTTPLSTEIKEVVSIVSKILKGAEVKDFPISQTDKIHIIDWNEMKRWNIPKKDIPVNWKIINIPAIEEYRTLFIVGALITFFILVLAVASMVYLFKRENIRKKKVQEDLNWKNKFLTLALGSGNIFAWRYNLKTKIITFDKDFFEYLKIEPRQYGIAQLESIVHPDDYKKTITDFKKQVELGIEKSTSKIRANFLGENYSWWEFRYAPTVSNSNGEEPIIAGLCLNIQEYKDKEQELIDARDLAAKTELKQSFLANMSHEIRTPLNAIVGFSNLLTGENDEFSQEERMEFTDSINKNCEILLKLINDILELSRIESGNMSFKLEPVSINGLLNDIYTTHMLLMPANVKLIKEIMHNDITVNIDRVRLTQVLTNLINNATKFTEQGHIIVGYNIGLSQKKNELGNYYNELVIYVSDTGKGIPKDQQKAIFERFYKQDEFVQGTGLGLSICNVIIKHFGGYIALDSQVGKGSCFTIHIPFNDNYDVMCDTNN
ncbi:MAG: HAMP domain-containing sensor histidine kinase [Bacteroidales bacterium]